jgi:WD40 repeat protein
MQLANENITEFPLPPTDFHPSGVAQAVNVLWFSSLILSLFAALFGIFVKQWLHTYGNWSDIADPRKAVLVREMYSRALKTWHVLNILATLPFLLQLALLFFCAGLVAYLWTVDYVVAGFLSVLVVAGFIAAVVAIALPVFFENCSYKSPLGLLLVRFLESSFPSWRERDLGVLEKALPEDEGKHIHSYNEVCALLEITPKADGLLSMKELVVTRVNIIKVHSDTALFKLLQTILSVFADGSPSNDRPEILQSMLHVLNAAVSAGKKPMPISVIHGFVKHVIKTRPRVLDSSDDIKEQLSSIYALANCIAHQRTTFNVSGLAEPVTQLRSWLYQWGAVTSDRVSGNAEYQENRPTLDSLLLQRFSLGHPIGVNCAAFSRDGSQIISGLDDGIVRVWDHSTGKVVQELIGHTRGVSSVSFSPDGTRVVSGSYDKTVRVWDVSSGAEPRTLEGHIGRVEAVAFSPNGTHIVSGWWDGTVRIWDVDSGADHRKFEGHIAPVQSVAFSPDGTRIVSGSWDKTVLVWDTDSGIVLRTLKGHANRVQSVAFSPDGTRIVSGSWDRTTRIWDADSGAELQALRGHSSWVLSVAFSPGGTRVVSGSRDKTVRVWNATSGAELQTLKGHTGLVGTVGFSPDGARIISSGDQTVRVWDADAGADLRTLDGHTNKVQSVAFSPDGTRIVSGSDDETVRIWDAASGAAIRTLNGHTRSVRSVAFSPDGTRIVSGSPDKTVRVWDANSGAELQALKGVTGSVQSVAFSSDGTSITCQTMSGASHTWTAPHDFPLPTSPLLLPPPAPSSPTFTLDSSWILGQKDPHSPSRRLFWVVPERRGNMLSHGHRVLLSFHTWGTSRTTLTLLDLKEVM